ncbi:MAG: hypothetical protein RR413_10005 [Christensenellaceae bacterium]
MEDQNKEAWIGYYKKVKHDFEELRKRYPFSELILPPTVKPSQAKIISIAVEKRLVEAINGRQNDFLGTYSKQIYLEIPFDYAQRGCIVYGGKWIDVSNLKPRDIHLYGNKKLLINNPYGYELCVGTPESCSHMRNVILEAVRTADNLLVAYERVQTGESSDLILHAYSHGVAGRNEFVKDRMKYVLR